MASRTLAQAPQVLQVASEYVAGQMAMRLPAGVYTAAMKPCGHAIR